MDVQTSLTDLKTRIKLRIDKKYLSFAVKNEISRLSQDGFNLSIQMVLQITTPFYGLTFLNVIFSLSCFNYFGFITETCLDYLERWPIQFEYVESFQWAMLKKDLPD